MPHTEADQLETTGRWNEAAEYWRRRYSDAHDPEAAVRLAFVCWYVLAESHCIPMAEPLTDEDFFRFTATLQNVTADVLSRHGADPEIQFYFGYMASLFPWYFGAGDEAVTEWERRASDLLRQAHEARPSDPVLEMVCLGAGTSAWHPTAKYLEACRRAHSVVVERYSGTSEFDNYFRDVLSRAA